MNQQHQVYPTTDLIIPQNMIYQPNERMNRTNGVMNQQNVLYQPNGQTNLQNQLNQTNDNAQRNLMSPTNVMTPAVVYTTQGPKIQFEEPPQAPIGLTARQKNLLLMECYVNSLTIDKHMRKAFEQLYKTGLLCVTFNLMNCAKLQICEEGPPPKRRDHILANFTRGKSGVFTFNSIFNEVNPDLCQLNVSAAYRTPDGMYFPDELPIGIAIIDVTQDIGSLILEAKTFPDRVPIARTIVGSYLLVDRNSIRTGTINFGLRVTCFGSMIVQPFKVCSKKPEPVHITC